MRSEGSERSSDDYRVEHLRDALAHDPATTELDVRITVIAGRIVLTGYASTVEHKDAISSVVRRLAPDLDVLNEMDLAELRAPGEAEPLT
jgi:osmotically-inducible protein OsmY